MVPPKLFLNSPSFCLHLLNSSCEPILVLTCSAVFFYSLLFLPLLFPLRENCNSVIVQREYILKRTSQTVKKDRGRGSDPEPDNDKEHRILPNGKIFSIRFIAKPANRNPEEGMDFPDTNQRPCFKMIPNLSFINMWRFLTMTLKNCGGSHQ